MQLSEWSTSDGQSGLLLATQVVVHLLNPSLAEFSASFVGRLVVMLIKQVCVYVGEHMYLGGCSLMSMSHDPSPGGWSAGRPPGEHCPQPPQQAAQRGHLHGGPVPEGEEEWEDDEDVNDIDMFSALLAGESGGVCACVCVCAGGACCLCMLKI